MKVQAFYYAMPTLAVIVIGTYIFTSVKLHKFIWLSPVVYLALIGSVGLWIKIGMSIFYLRNWSFWIAYTRSNSLRGNY